MKNHKNIVHGHITCFSLSIGSAQDPIIFDSTLSNILPQSISNSIEVADVDNDGTNDIIFSGYDSTRFGVFLDVIKTNSTGSLQQGFSTNFVTYSDTIAEYLGGIGNIKLADVNLDGSIDIYLNGSVMSKLMLNSSSGNFSQSSWLQNMFVTYSNGDWGDVNMDGKPDLFLMGVNEFTDQILNELFINMIF